MRERVEDLIAADDSDSQDALAAALEANGPCHSSGLTVSCEAALKRMCPECPPVDLESIVAGSIEFEPPTWHASVGACMGYLDPAVHAIQARGRPPTRSST